MVATPQANQAANQAANQKPVVTITSGSEVSMFWPMNVQPIVSQEQFAAIAQANPELRLELSAQGELIVMPPAESTSGRRNLTLSGQLAAWVEQNEDLGEGFDSSTGFTLPDRSIISPDAAWIKKSRWDALTPEEQDGFAPICPDVAIELRSKTDRLKAVREKMQMYLSNGVRLGVLLNPQKRGVELYRPDQAVEVLQKPSTVDLSEVMPNFILNLDRIFR
ncbi:MAG: Uma2 family endonuclease [Phormidesmis sp.]